MNPTVSLSNTGSPIGQLPAAGTRIQGREQLILRLDTRVGEGVHERALAGICVTDQRHGHVLPSGGDLAFLAALDPPQVTPQFVDASLDQAAVFFQLFFTRTTHPDAHLQTREVGPHPLETGQRVFQLSQLDRQTGLVGLGMCGENIEDQLRAIEDLGLGGLFQSCESGRGSVHCQTGRRRRPFP